MIRIAQEVTGTTSPAAGGIVWPTTAFFVRDMNGDGAREVTSPDQARDVASQMAYKLGTGVYRGSLPKAWREALDDLARS